MQTKSIPELIIGFFKTIFYAFYYSGYGVIGVLKYLFMNVLMSLMRGPIEEASEEPPVQEDQFMVNAIADTPSDESGSASSPATAMIQAGSGGGASDAIKDDGGQLKISGHELTNVASGERLGEGAGEDGSVEQAEQQIGESEPPMTLVSVFCLFLSISITCKLNKQIFMFTPRTTFA